MAKELPFSFIASSFTAVVTPQAIRLISNCRIQEFRVLWADYLEIGYTVTWPLCIGAMIMVPQLIEILYSTKYLTDTGTSVFQIYTLVAMIRFTYFGLVPTALGETRILLYYSIFGVIINMILNYILYYTLGMIGPPLATFISIVVMGFFYFRRSLKLSQSSFAVVFRIRKIVALLLEMLIMGIFTQCLTGWLNQYIQSAIVPFLVGYWVFVGCIVFLKYKDLLRLIRSMNHQKQ
ncbi:lipid II flippase MurJ [Eubacterium aggregans]|uniref:lipid II flippase MurJ n=1 Tax=Eubacterium aggregans TaxID=81409 RepID=UPI003F3DF40B